MRYLGLDLGTKTLGIAISDKTGLIASFYKSINYKNKEELFFEIKNIIEEEKIEEVVLGFPKNMNNTIGERAEETLKFKQDLENFLEKEVILEDERMTTKVAEDVLIKADLSRNKRKKVIDGVAATVILQSFLDRKER